MSRLTATAGQVVGGALVVLSSWALSRQQANDIGSVAADAAVSAADSRIVVADLLAEERAELALVVALLKVERAHDVTAAAVNRCSDDVAGLRLLLDGLNADVDALFVAGEVLHGASRFGGAVSQADPPPLAVDSRPAQKVPTYQQFD